MAGRGPPAWAQAVSRWVVPAAGAGGPGRPPPDTPPEPTPLPHPAALPSPGGGPGAPPAGGGGGGGPAPRGGAPFRRAGVASSARPGVWPLFGMRGGAVPADVAQGCLDLDAAAAGDV